MSYPVFRAGLNAERAEFRSTDVNGRPVDPAAETPTQRAERIEQLQVLRLAQGERGAPAADPAAVFTEWMAQSAANRMSGLGSWVAAHGRLPVEVEMEPRPGEQPRPDGLLARMARMRRDRGSAG